MNGFLEQYKLQAIGQTLYAFSKNNSRQYIHDIYNTTRFIFYFHFQPYRFLKTCKLHNYIYLNKMNKIFLLNCFP